MLANGKVDPSLIGQIKTDGSTEGANQTKNNEAMQKIIEENEKAMKVMQQSYEEKLAESKKQEVEIMKILFQYNIIYNSIYLFQ